MEMVRAPSSLNKATRQSPPRATKQAGGFSSSNGKKVKGPTSRNTGKAPLLKPDMALKAGTAAKITVEERAHLLTMKEGGIYLNTQEDVKAHQHSATVYS
mmetsp:Transcript_39042/g.59473  ORF Transcript_39042/g.59473 Transcript_39042/m.59473 type:complete len:100 (-) Transcript_39042:3081-3380(-)